MDRTPPNSSLSKQTGRGPFQSPPPTLTQFLMIQRPANQPVSSHSSPPNQERAPFQSPQVVTPAPPLKAFLEHWEEDKNVPRVIIRRGGVKKPWGFSRSEKQERQNQEAHATFIKALCNAFPRLQTNDVEKTLTQTVISNENLVDDRDRSAWNSRPLGGKTMMSVFEWALKASAVASFRELPEGASRVILVLDIEGKVTSLLPFNQHLICSYTQGEKDEQNTQVNRTFEQFLQNEYGISEGESTLILLNKAKERNYKSDLTSEFVHRTIRDLDEKYKK